MSGRVHDHAGLLGGQGEDGGGDGEGQVAPLRVGLQDSTVLFLENSLFTLACD